MFSLRTPPLMCESVFVCEFRVRYHGWQLYPGRQSKEIIPLIHTHTHHFKNYNFFSNGNKVWLLLKMSSQDTPGEMCIFMMCITSYFSSLNIRFWNGFSVIELERLVTTDSGTHRQGFQPRCCQRISWPKQKTSCWTENCLIDRARACDSNQNYSKGLNGNIMTKLSLFTLYYIQDILCGPHMLAVMHLAVFGLVFHGSYSVNKPPRKIKFQQWERLVCAQHGEQGTKYPPN